MRAGATLARIWHGWTTPENADTNEAVARGEVFPDIIERHIPGLIGADLGLSEVPKRNRSSSSFGNDDHGSTLLDRRYRLGGPVRW